MNRLSTLAVETCAAIFLLLAGSVFSLDVDPEGALRARLQELVEDGNIPGLAVAIAVDGEVVWKDAYGWADLENRRPMTTSTVLNVGSVSKLLTSTAVLQIWEQGKIDLDVDVSRYLPFTVRHPIGNSPMTVRQLLTHTAGLRDGEAYAASYACGDPSVSLEDWLRGYLLADGAYFDRANFPDQAPGRAFEYSNVGYGLLGLVVEHVSGRDFTELTRDRIFLPLGMKNTGWMLDEVDRDRHAIPYWVASPDAEPDPDERALLPAGPFAEAEHVPFCLYSFYNYPDGLLRTTIEDLAAFAMATIPGADVREPLLKHSTREQVFRNQIPDVETDGRLQGLGWRRHDLRLLGTLWGHGGADPGVRAHVLHRPEDGVTVLAMSNALVVEEFRPLLELLFAEGARRKSEESTVDPSP